MLLRNLDAPRLCNGTRLVVRQLLRNLIVADIITGEYAGETVFIPRITLSPNDTVYEFQRTQFPVRLSYAMSINKSQGQTLKVVGLNLQENCFSHGQFYVACSRVGGPGQLHMLTQDGNTKT